MAIFFFNGLGLPLGAKLVSTNDRLSIFFNIFRFFPTGGEKLAAPHFARTGWRYTPRHVCRFFRAKHRRSDLPMFNIKQNLAKKLDPRLKPSHLKEIAYLTRFYAQKSNLPTPCLRDKTLKFCIRCRHAHPEA